MIGSSLGTSENRIVSASDVLAKIKANQPANFDNCTIVGDLNFSKLKIDGELHFNHTNFQKSVYCESTTFNKTAYFENSNFNGLVTFLHPNFNKYADFRGSNFSGRGYNFTGATFMSSNFNGPADFENANFNGYTYFGSPNFNGYANFSFSNFNGTVTFWSSNFNGTANFGGSTFRGDANFWQSKFNGIAEFGNSIFNRTAEFGGSKFKQNAFFYGTVFKNELDLSFVEYSNLYISWNKSNKLAYSDTSYQLLIESLKRLGFMTDADECYYQFRVAQFEHQNLMDDPFMFMINFGAWIFYGFGKRPTYPLVWSIFFIGLFGVFWRIAGVAAPLRFSGRAFLSGTKVFIDPPEIPKYLRIPKPKWLNYLVNRFGTSLLEDVLTVERILGAFFSILFFLAISSTVVR